jgi:hypothetical protein
MEKSRVQVGKMQRFNQRPDILGLYLLYVLD